MKLVTAVKLVVFDFDDTIYAKTLFNGKISCYRESCPMFELSDRAFLEQLLRWLRAQGIHIGVASFGKKSLIIECMNTLVGGGEPYFDETNVLTVPDVPDKWKKALAKSNSTTFHWFVKKHNGDVDAAFNDFLQMKPDPQKVAKYFCVNLGGRAKLKMIEQLIERYGGGIKMSEVLYFDDNIKNVEITRQNGVNAFHVPCETGLTSEWWQSVKLPIIG